MLALVIIAIASLAALVVVMYWAATYLLRQFTSVRLPWPTRFEHLISPANWLGDEHSKYVLATLGLAAFAVTAIGVGGTSGDESVDAAQPSVTIETRDGSVSLHDSDGTAPITEATPEATGTAVAAAESVQSASGDAPAVTSTTTAHDTTEHGQGNTTSAPVEESITTTVAVTNVVDGDTIDTTLGPIRILGYDTPEAGECGHQEATDTLTNLLASGTITITSDDGDDTDRYGRLLRHVIVDGDPVGLTMIELGKADARYDSVDGYPRHRHQDQYREADGANTFACAIADLPPATTSAPAPTPTPAPAPAPAPATAPPPESVYYKNCDAARDAGAAPVHVGQPGYASHLDRDNDGVGCE